MNKHVKKIAVGLAAFAFGAALTAPAFAQNAGRNPNDGGLIQEPSAAQISAASPQTKQSKKPRTKISAQSQPVNLGRAANDGGIPPEPNAADLAAASRSQSAPQAAASPRPGRNPDDGGLVP